MGECFVDVGFAVRNEDHDEFKVFGTLHITDEEFKC
jgi:hypothetical protein